MDEKIISGVIYSQFDTIGGPTAVACVPSHLSTGIQELVSNKSINLMEGEKGLINSSLAIIPFADHNLKGLTKIMRMKEETRRGGVIESAITLLFKEAYDTIFYKYLPNFEAPLSNLAATLFALEERNAEKPQVEAELAQFYASMRTILKELYEAEMESHETMEFPKGEEEPIEPYTYILKIIVCGDPMVGKTSTVLRYTDKAFKRTYIPTIGTNITEKRMRFGDEVVAFAIWDIAGQSKFQMMRKHYYKGAQGALLIFDLTRPDTFDNIANWYRDIKSFIKGDLPGFLLGNKSDLAEQRQVEPAAIANLAKTLDLEYLETSAYSGKNIDAVFTKLGELLIASIKKNQ